MGVAPHERTSGEQAWEWNCQLRQSRKTREEVAIVEEDFDREM